MHNRIKVGDQIGYGRIKFTKAMLSKIKSELDKIDKWLWAIISNILEILFKIEMGLFCSHSWQNICHGRIKLQILMSLWCTRIEICKDIQSLDV
jgi:hypothetical protein